MDVLLFPFGFSTKILSHALSYVQSNKFLTEEINPAPVEDFALTDGGAFLLMAVGCRPVFLLNNAWPNYKILKTTNAMPVGHKNKIYGRLKIRFTKNKASNSQTPINTMKKEENPCVSVDAKYNRIRFNAATMERLKGAPLAKVRLLFDMRGNNVTVDLLPYVGAETKEKTGGVVFRSSKLVKFLKQQNDKIVIDGKTAKYEVDEVTTLPTTEAAMFEIKLSDGLPF